VAATLDELELLMTDLPGTDLGRVLERGTPGPVQVPAGGSALAWRSARRFWFAISVVVFVIWLLGGASGGPWFLGSCLAGPADAAALDRGRASP
jgi:hypothetical protein